MYKRQVEGLGGGVEGGSAHPGVLTDGLGGDVLVAGEDDVRPDLVGYDVDIILFVQYHGLFQLPPLPDAAAGAVSYTHLDVYKRQDYYFYVELVGDPSADETAALLRELDHTCRPVRLLGCLLYTSAEG